MIFNYYEILGIPYDATKEDVKMAYRNKIINAHPNMVETIKTAYYILIDDKRRLKYDKFIGLHRYKKKGFITKTLKGISRVVLTILDALFSFYWCFFIVTIGYGIYLYIEGDVELLEFLMAYKLEEMLLIGFGLLDLLCHFYIRRLNRYLKHKHWEL